MISGDRTIIQDEAASNVRFRPKADTGFDKPFGRIDRLKF